MTPYVVFGVVLIAAVLLSGLAHRTVLSTAVLFLVAGFLAGDGVLDLMVLSPEDPLVERLAELALFAVLFTDGMLVGLRELGAAWRLPGRALLFGMPLTLAATAVLAHFVAGLAWAHAFLIGAVLSPTDPVFASAIVGREEVPRRLRRLLNVESGLNDGLALPLVVVLIAVVGGRDAHTLVVVGEALGGIALGVAVPWAAIRLERSPAFAASTRYQPLNAFAIGFLVLVVALATHLNEFLAAFAAGVTVATVGPEVREAFHRFGDLIAEILKLAALLVFGALITPTFLAEIGLGGYVFAVLALLLVRPFSLGLALWGSGLSRPQRLAAAWFGPKGFASMVYALVILRAGVRGADVIFHLVALVVAASIVVHSSTDVLVARRFRGDDTDAATPTEGRPADAEAGGRLPEDPEVE